MLVLANDLGYQLIGNFLEELKLLKNRIHNMRIRTHSKVFAKAFALVLSTGMSFGVAPSLMADESIPAVGVSNGSVLNQLFSKQWVCLDKEGSIDGSLVQLVGIDKAPLAGLPVSLVRDGEVAYSALADDVGSFKFENVKTGSYSLVTRTNESIAAFSLQVLGAENTHLSSSVEVRVVRPAGMKVKEILRSQTLPTYAVRAELPQVSKDPLGDSRSFSKSHFVKLDSNGKLTGQLGSVLPSADMSEMVVYVLKNGEEVAKAIPDKQGKFSINGLRPGVYGFVAAGYSGFAATSFQLVDTASASIGTDGSRFVSSIHDACGQMNVEVVQCCEVAVCEQPVQTIVETIVQSPVDPCAVPVDQCGSASTCGCGGGFGGGFGGGGGGGGGLFGGGRIGLGGLAAIGGLTALGIIAADNNNDAPVVSPVGP